MEGAGKVMKIRNICLRHGKVMEFQISSKLFLADG